VQEKARALIDDYLRPLIEADGGTIELVEVSEQRIVLRLSGTCAGCPGKPYTLTGVIEPAVRRALGAKVHVEARFE
jgi:Fe-S cluster biogenesis protein NfuA